VNQAVGYGDPVRHYGWVTRLDETGEGGFDAARVLEEHERLVIGRCLGMSWPVHT
jgi:hypothetical protein